jgi:hypothetical protein
MLASCCTPISGLLQVGCYNTCCNTPQQICNQFTRQCVDRFNTACTGGQNWCPGANQCCNAGQVCAGGACMNRGALPVFGRRLMGASDGQQQ